MCHIFAGQDPERYQLETRRMRLNGQSTSIRLEKSFWRILDEIANSEGLTLPAFVSKLHDEVLQLHGEPKNFTALLRCACLVWLELPNDQHRRARHRGLLWDDRQGRVVTPYYQYERGVR